ncbi:MAG: hypothetical protein H6Q67_1023 [Firmicutes bacterium]|nr:hypothetical protein [Bacillota bacterium]
MLKQGYWVSKAGMDTEMPVGAAYRQLGQYVESGELDISIIDEAVRRAEYGTVRFLQRGYGVCSRTRQYRVNVRN